MSTSPRRTDIHAPGYDEFLRRDDPPLEWAWAEERLAASHNYWLSTVGREGQPHTMPVWAVWLGGRLLFSSGERSRKARNLRADPRCTIATERGEEAVIVEGVASPVPRDELAAFVEAYRVKYDWDMSADVNPVFAVEPRVVFAFSELPDTAPGRPTRWEFRD